MSVERFPAPPTEPRRAPADFRLEGCVVRPRLNRVVTPVETVTLEPKVMRVLLRLAERPGEVVTKEELFRDVWEGAYVTEDVLTRAIGELRRLFGDEAARPRVIETIRKSGYRLISAIEPATTREAEPAVGSGSPAPPAPTAAPANRSRRPIAAGLLVLAAVAAAVLLLRFRAERSTANVRILPVTSYPGNERDPAISPDGTRVAFGWNGGGTGKDMSLYVALIDSETPLRVTSQPGVEDRTPAWSPDGKRIAFTRATPADCRILLVSALGGPEKPLAPCGDSEYRRLAWSPDGRWLALSRRDAGGVLALELLSPDTLERRALTRPPAGILGDTSPAFSPDGRTISFTRNLTDGVNDIYRVSREGGEPQRLTFDDRDTMGSAWTEDGGGLVFSSSRAGIYSLWRVPARGGEPVWVAGGGTKLKHPSAARARRLVAFENWIYEVNLWRVPAGSSGGKAEPLRLTEANDQWNFEPHVSPDGRRIVFVSTRSGNDELWVVESEGGRQTRLTSFGGARLETPRWSPDGRSLVFSARAPARADLYTISADGGVPRRLTREASDAVCPRWSHDGRSVYFASRRDGPWRVWRLDVASQAIAAVTAAGGYAAEESPDGRWLYFTRADAPGIWRQASGAGPESSAERVTDRLAPEDWANWAVGSRGVYLRQARHGEPQSFVAFLAHGAAEPVEVAPLPEQGWSGIAVSPDGEWIVYARADRHTCDIRAIENPA
jgi:Tol biopolymer transport system component/DNA-binding winged helix-turn-helix (wHTH) protein